MLSINLMSSEAIGHHGCLVFVALSLLHLTCLPDVPDRAQLLIHTIRGYFIHLSPSVQKCYDCSQSMCEQHHTRLYSLKEGYNVSD